MGVAVTLQRFAATIPRSLTGDVAVAALRVFETRAWVAYQSNESQIELRHRYDIGPVLGLDVLDTLMSLPLGLPVPAAAVMQADRRRLSRLPTGAVTWAPSTITRHIAPSVTPVLAMVRSRNALLGIRQASRFAAYCPRMVIVPTPPPDEVLVQASFYGIGVAVDSPDGPQVLLAAENLADWQPTPAWWWFTEVVHRAAGTGSVRSP